MRRKESVLIGLITPAILSCTAPKTVDPVGNSKRLPIGRDRSIDRDTSASNKPNTAVTDTLTESLPPSGEKK